MKRSAENAISLQGKKFKVTEIKDILFLLFVFIAYS